MSAPPVSSVPAPASTSLLSGILGDLRHAFRLL